MEGVAYLIESGSLVGVPYCGQQAVAPPFPAFVIDIITPKIGSRNAALATDGD